MNSEHEWLLFSGSLLVVWMTFHSCRSRFNCLLVNALRVALLLSALSLPALATEPDGKAAEILADALNGLSDDDLKMHHSAIQAACGRVNPLLLILPDAFVVKSLQRQHQRRGGQRQTKRPRFTWDQFARNGLVPIDGPSEVSDASYTKKIIVKPCAGKRHAPFERGN